MVKISFVALALIIAPAFAFAQASGVFMIVKGDVKVTTKAGATEVAKAGKKVTEGDTIVSGADSRAKIVMSDKNVINVLPDSKMTIAKYGDAAGGDKNVELKVEYGKVRAAVEQKYDGDKSKFNIKTPSAVAGVRGTDFITGYNPSTKETSVVTFSGAVAVGSIGANGVMSQPVYVKEGESTKAVDGKAPEAPKPLSKEEMQQVQSESLAEAPTKQDVSTGEAQKEDKKEDKKEETKAEDSKKTEEAKKEEPKKEDVKKEEAKREEPKKEEAKREEPRREEAKTDQKREPASKAPDCMSCEAPPSPRDLPPPPPQALVPRPPPTPPPPPPTPPPQLNQNSRVNIIIKQGQ